MEARNDLRRAKIWVLVGLMSSVRWVKITNRDLTIWWDVCADFVAFIDEQFPDVVCHESGRNGTRVIDHGSSYVLCQIHHR